MAIQVTSRPTPQIGTFTVSEAASARVDVIMARYPDDRKASGIIPLLDIAQREKLVAQAQTWPDSLCGLPEFRFLLKRIQDCFVERFRDRNLPTCYAEWRALILDA